jgi:hypothetical protein
MRDKRQLVRIDDVAILATVAVFVVAFVFVPVAIAVAEQRSGLARITGASMEQTSGSE